MESKFSNYEKIIKNCKKCDLCKNRTNVVPGNGNPNAKIVVIGQAPGMNEDLSSKEFVGNSGQFLKYALDIVGLDESELYFTSVVKCRPKDNKIPKPKEILSCLDYLRFQVMTIKPKVIVLLGKVAFNSIFGFDQNFSQNRGNIIEKKGIKYLVTYHPSAVLRDESKKNIFINDLKKIKEIS